MGKYVSMDLFWTKDGQPYKFDRSKLSESINWVHGQYLEALGDCHTVVLIRGLPGSGKSSVAKLLEAVPGIVVVDNTHTTMKEMNFYLDMADQEGKRVHILHVERELYESARDNTHDVAWSKIVEMAGRWEPVVSRDPLDILLAIESDLIGMLGGDGLPDRIKELEKRVAEVARIVENVKDLKQE